MLRTEIVMGMRVVEERSWDGQGGREGDASNIFIVTHLER